MFRPLFKGFLKLGQNYKNIFVVFLVQMKTLKFAFEINWPLGIGQKLSDKNEKGWELNVFSPPMKKNLSHFDFMYQPISTADPFLLLYMDVLYQISPSQVSKNNFLLVRMSFNHDKMFVWNASIWVRGPCIRIHFKIGALIKSPAPRVTIKSVVMVPTLD